MEERKPRRLDSEGLWNYALRALAKLRDGLGRMHAWFQEERARGEA